jgi:hypothetical protein
MKKYVLRSMVRAILDQPRVPKRYQSAMNAEILKKLTESVPRRKNKTRTPEERFWRRVLQQDSCWLWRGRSMNISTAPGVVVHPRRFALERFAGVTVPDGRTAYPTCGYETCVNPEHLTLRRKGSSRLSEEQVAAIKSDTRPYPQIAKEFAICRSYVSQIRSGKRRPPQSQPDSGFKLRTPPGGSGGPAPTA